MNLLLRYILACSISSLILSLCTLQAQPKIVGTNYKYGIIDEKTGVQICDTIYQSISIESNRIRVKDRNGWGILNLRGEVIIPTKYIYIEAEEKGITKVSMSNDGKVVWGAYDSTGRIVIPFIHNYDSLKDAIKEFELQRDLSNPPIISLLSHTIAFHDANLNNAIDANESCEIVFSVVNNGKGPARNCMVRTLVSGDKSGISSEDISVPFIDRNETVEILIPIKSSIDTKDGKITFNIRFDEPNGFGTDPFTIDINTKSFEAPLVKITDYALTGTTGSLQKKVPFNLQLLLQNVKYGEASDVSVTISVPDNVFILDGETNRRYTTLTSGEAKSLEYSMIANSSYV